MTTVRAMITTPDLDRLPAEGPPSSVGLRLGNSGLGLIADAGSDLGGPVLGPPADIPWGQRVVHLRDPDGNAVDQTQDLEPAA